QARGTVRSTWSTASRSPKRLLRPRARMAGSVDCGDAFTRRDHRVPLPSFPRSFPPSFPRRREPGGLALPRTGSVRSASRKPPGSRVRGNDGTGLPGSPTFWRSPPVLVFDLHPYRQSGRQAGTRRELDLGQVAQPRCVLAGQRVVRGEGGLAADHAHGAFERLFATIDEYARALADGDVRPDRLRHVAARVRR